MSRKINNSCLAIVFLIASVGRSSIGWAAQSQVRFDVIADSATSPPGHSDLTFKGLTTAANRVYQGSAIIKAVARGDDPFGEHVGGFYKWDSGQLTALFESSSIVPGSNGAEFGSFGPYDIRNDVFVFAGSASGVDLTGVYGIINDELVKVIDSSTPIANSSLTLAGIGGVQTDGANVVFKALLQDTPGTNEFTEAIMSATIDGKNLRILVDENTNFPNQSQQLRGYSSLGGFENGRLVFHASDNPLTEIGTRFGVFTVDLDGNVNTVADFDTPQPGTDLDIGFFNVAYPAITGDTAAFVASNAEGNGIYGADLNSGELFTIVDDETLYPDLPGQTTTIMTDPSLDGENLAFTVVGLDDRFPGLGFIAIMMQIDGEIHRILGKGDMFQGREVSFLQMSTESFEGQSVVFYAKFTDGFEGVYMASLIPTPGSGFLVVISGAYLGLKRRRLCVHELRHH